MTTHPMNDKKNPFQIINILEHNPCSRDCLMENLGIKISAFYKNLNILKKAGFTIRKENKLYELIRFYSELDFSSYELCLFAYLSLLAYIFLPDYKTVKFEKALERIFFLSDKNQYLSLNKQYESLKNDAVLDFYKEKIFVINKFILKKQEAKIIINTKREIHSLPKRLCWHNKQMALEYLDIKTGKNKKISLEKVVKVVEKEQEDTLLERKETIFELYGRLARSYLLKENERIVDSFADRIVVASSAEDKTMLFKRLLRYDVLCKIIFPKTDAKEFQKMISKTLDNIDKIHDNIVL